MKTPPSYPKHVKVVALYMSYTSKGVFVLGLSVEIPFTCTARTALTKYSFTPTLRDSEERRAYRPMVFSEFASTPGSLCSLI